MSILASLAAADIGPETVSTCFEAMAVACADDTLEEGDTFGLMVAL
jgi:hypothetical protein